MSKQTAVEWLVEKYELVGMLTPSMIERAKAMEKEQIEEAYGTGHNDGCAYMYDGNQEFVNPEHYYNETYKGGEQ